ncbi:ubiquinone biosynthesis O-methyltransferase, mitochondrial [Podarcis lilfordi]|uniref:Ubiquinone biosynthesis O-methyltransferase, mitochondrial n=1 Tax=Podarcis lilfordi TaxID=74358 RepID=A0AA35K3Y1_9SAUR|nr:ubiquinone biosynthesis O-methyltransferase, mitochondrial [Podarcis lilfordi]
MKGWQSGCLSRARRLWVFRGEMAGGWAACRRALSSCNHYGQPPQIVQIPFLKRCKNQLKYHIFVSLVQARNTMLLTERHYSMSQTTVDPKEMKKFQLLAHKWWDEHGDYAALHSMNDIRVPFIRDTVLNMRNDHQPGSPLSGVKILDVGCGGGLLTEPLGRLGASVTGIDPLEDSIRTAELHKSFDPVLAKRIQYKSCTLEDIVEEASDTFDVIVASEVVEHVADVEMFIRCCSKVLKPEGSLFITTINKSQLSYIFGIVVAERVLGIVPTGTHDWEKFIPPEELERLLESNGFLVKTVKGMLYNPLFGSWSWTESTIINYALHAVKSDIQEQVDPNLETDKEQLQTKTMASEPPAKTL